MYVTVHIVHLKIFRLRHLFKTVSKISPEEINASDWANICACFGIVVIALIEVDNSERKHFPIAIIDIPAVIKSTKGSITG